MEEVLSSEFEPYNFISLVELLTYFFFFCRFFLPKQITREAEPSDKRRGIESLTVEFSTKVGFKDRDKNTILGMAEDCTQAKYVDHSRYNKLL